MCKENCEHQIKQKEYFKTYYQNKKDDLLEKNKKYYYEHREQSLAYKKEYLKNNKDKLQAVAKQRYDCNHCNGSYTYSNKSKHLLSKKHLNSLNTHVEPSNQSSIN